MLRGPVKVTVWRGTAFCYLSELLIAVNLVLSLLPSPFTMAMIANEIPAAISPYSMAVAAVSSAKNRRKVFMGASMGSES
jgi:hypothetical protein